MHSHTVISVSSMVIMFKCVIFVSTLDNVVAKYAAGFENSLIVDKGTEAHPTSEHVIFCIKWWLWAALFVL